MQLIEKYFLNSLLSVAPRCALASATLRLGAYNTAYAVRGSVRPSPIFLLPLVAKTSHTLER
jgi:ABC-type arginine/histidine transport system permease subunit